MSEIFFIGDSITAGAWDEQGGWANRLSGRIMQKTLHNPDFFCLPYNLGISGDTVPDVIARIETELHARLCHNEHNSPVQILFSIGINDSIYMVKENRPRFTAEEFRDNLEALIRSSRRVTDNIAFTGLIPVDDDLLNPVPWSPDKAYTCRRVKLFEDIISDLCQMKDIGFLPLFDAWRALPDYKEYLFDGLHPNSRGHELLAHQIGDFVSQLYTLQTK